jgi:hypothetical protein
MALNTPPSKSTANQTATADLAALQAAAGALFLDQATVAINQAIAAGLFTAYCTTFENCDIHGIVVSLNALGYAVGFPDIYKNTGSQANSVQQFGPNWSNFWANGGIPALVGPVRIAISWQ